jgi:hypothetical protein
MTDSVSAALPSNVLEVVGDQRCFPIRLPIMDACIITIRQSFTCPRSRVSPTRHRHPLQRYLCTVTALSACRATEIRTKESSDTMPRHAPFEPYGPSTAGKQIEMAKYCSSLVLVVQKVIHEQVHKGIERINGKVSDIFGECEQGERCTERQMCKCGLMHHINWLAAV